MTVHLWSCSPRELLDPSPSPDPSMAGLGFVSSVGPPEEEGVLGFLTSYMKMSKTRVATGSGKVVKKSVRNQDEAYMDVWKLWERKWVFRSGSCS